MAKMVRPTRVAMQIGCLMGCLAGLAISYIIQHQVSYVIVLLFIFAAIMVRRVRLLVMVLLFITGLAIGMNRGALFVTEQHRYQRLFDSHVVATVVAMSDAVYDSRAQLTFTGRNFTPQTSKKPFKGTIQISGFGTNAVFAGDTVLVTGKLRAPYGSGQGSIGFAHLEVIAHHTTLFAEARRSFTNAIQTSLPEPLAAFGSGLLIGQRSTLPKDVKAMLLAVGLTHIIAVSGYNLTILVQALRRSWLRYIKRLNYWLSIAVMVGFVLITGGSASILRAIIVSVISITVGYYGRSISPFFLLLIAAAITGWDNPFYVWGDASWYLSFLAFAGILLFAPLLIARWRLKNLFALVLVETVSAELMTVPYVLATFGQISLVSLPANVLVVSLVPLAMLVTTISGMATLLWQPIAGWLAWPAQICLTYMLDIARLLAKIPHSFQKNIVFSIRQMFFVYGLVGMVYLVLRYQASLRRDKITEITENLQRSRVSERSQQMVND